MSVFGVRVDLDRACSRPRYAARVMEPDFGVPESEADTEQSQDKAA